MIKEIYQYGPGKSFGEKAIEESKPRAATVYVKSDAVIVATLTRADYIKVIGTSFKNQLDNMVKTMRHFLIFRKLAALRIKSIYYHFIEINACKDQYLYK